MKEHGPPRRSRVSVVEKKQHLRPPGSLRNCLVGILLVCGNEIGKTSQKSEVRGGVVVVLYVEGLSGLGSWLGLGPPVFACFWLLGLSRAHPP